MNIVYSLSIRVSYSATVIHRNPRGTGFGGRGGKLHVQDKPLPPSYVCYRCGQKGSLWPTSKKLCRAYNVNC